MQLRQSDLLLVNSTPTTASNPKDDQEEIPEQSPVTFLESLFPQGYKRGRAFMRHSDDEMEDYTMDVVRAVRAKDVTKLCAMLLGGRSTACLESCNRNHEYILHLACRRGNVERSGFSFTRLAFQRALSTTWGRSILHDVCWKSSPGTQLMDLLLTSGVPPESLLAQDARGHSPFDYARKAHWPAWNAFLKQRQDVIRPNDLLLLNDS
jgi:hypothetical protein